MTKNTKTYCQKKGGCDCHVNKIQLYKLPFHLVMIFIVQNDSNNLRVSPIIINIFSSHNLDLLDSK